MKKPLLVLLLFFCGITARAQVITMSDLTNIAGLNNTDAHNYLTDGKKLRQIYSQEVNGFTLGHYQVSNTDQNKETVIIGDGTKTASGSILHTVRYITTQTKYLITLVAQATGVGLTKNFQGADKYQNIYLFDNFLYTVNIYIKNDNSGGTVEIKQKDFQSY